MGKSLRIKIVFIMLLLIVLLMTVVSVFLIYGVQNFYNNEFYVQMSGVFADEEFIHALRQGASGDMALDSMQNVMSAYAGQLGVDLGDRNYYILDGQTGQNLASSDTEAGAAVEITANILLAMTGRPGYDSNITDKYMDVAVPIQGDNGQSYIIYILDNKDNVRQLNKQIFSIIAEAAAVGIVITAGVSLFISGTMLQPIKGMTKASQSMAKGDFSRKIEVQSDDEIGILADNFNDMASQLENMLDKLRQAETLRREFVANVSHELRTPVTSIRSYAETLQENIQDMPPEMTESFLNVIVNESDRMTKIVQDLLELSRYDSGRSNLQVEEFSIEKSVRDIYAAVALEAQKRQHEVNLELEWHLPYIWGDRAKIEQVILNIMTNAIKYTPDGGKIDIFASSDEKNVYVVVKDNGVGIPEEDLPRVFDRFYRVDKARSRASGGTGLGLAIAQEIIRRHNGEILVDSIFGQGTEFTIRLPIEGPENEESRD